MPQKLPTRRIQPWCRTFVQEMKTHPLDSQTRYLQPTPLSSFKYYDQFKTLLSPNSHHVSDIVRTPGRPSLNRDSSILTVNMRFPSHLTWRYKTAQKESSYTHIFAIPDTHARILYAFPLHVHIEYSLLFNTESVPVLPPRTWVNVFAPHPCFESTSSPRRWSYEGYALDLGSL